MNLQPSHVISGSPNWVSEDVGGAYTHGQTAFNGGTYTVQGSGSDSYGYDQFQYAFSFLNGDGTLITRLVGTSGTPSNGKAGIMIRDSLDSTSSNAFLFLQGPSTVKFTSRVVYGGSTATAGSTSIQAPIWLKLIRQSGTITAYTSLDGASWTQVGSMQTQMGVNVYAGLAVISEDNANLLTGTFDNVSSSTPGFSLTTPEPLIVSPPNAIATTSVLQTVVPGFTDIVNLSLSGLPPGVTANLSSSSLAGLSSTALTFSISSTAAPGSYPIVVTGNSSQSAQTLTLTLDILPSQNTPAAGWSSGDFGNVGAPGQTLSGGGVFTMQGAGQSSTRAARPDAFQFAYTALLGDGSISARLSNIAPYTITGIMIRSSVDPNGQFVEIGPVGLYYRSANFGAITTAANANDTRSPQWFKLVRQGNSFTAYSSLDGSTWIQFSQTVSVPMTASVYAGLMVSSNALNKMGSALFDNVSISSSGTGFFLSGPASVIASASSTTTIPVSIIGTPGFSDTVALTALDLPVGVSASFVPITVNGTGNSLLTFTFSNGVAAGAYPLTISGSGSSQTTTVPLSLWILGSLPQNWNDGFIGNNASQGQSGSINQSFIVQGAGSGFSTQGDQLQYASSTWTGDGSIVVHLSALQNGGSSGGAGIMFRDSMDANANFVALYQSANTANQSSNILYFEGRSASGQQAAGRASTNYLQIPEWLKLTRQGNTFTAYVCSDSIHWIPVGSPIAVPIASTALAGTFSFSGSPTQFDVASFDTVLVGNIPNPAAQSVLPPSWNSQDVGPVGIPGQDSASGGIFTIQGSGSAVNGTADEFQYGFTGLEGDGSIVARLASVQDTSAYSRIGLMIRDTASPQSRDALIYLRNGNAFFLTRTSDGSWPNTIGSTASQTPVWFKLVRQGNNFSAYTSLDGTNWTQLGSTTAVTMGTNVTAGLFVSSSDDTELATATFDNVTVTSSTTGFALSSSTTALAAAPGTMANMALAQTGTPGFADTVTYSVSGLPPGVTASFNPASLAGSGSVGMVLTVPSNTASGTYPITITGIGSNSGLVQSLSTNLAIQNF